MIKNILTIFIILQFFQSLITPTFAFEINECPSVKYVAKDLGYNVSKHDKDVYKLSKEGAVFFAEVDKEFCTVTFIANVFDSSEVLIDEIISWNNSQKLGKGVYDKNNIYFEHFLILAEATDELLALNIFVYGAALSDFHDHLSEIEKVKIKI